jgi:hypothetical protein
LPTLGRPTMATMLLMVILDFRFTNYDLIGLNRFINTLLIYKYEMPKSKIVIRKS